LAVVAVVDLAVVGVVAGLAVVAVVDFAVVGVLDALAVVVVALAVVAVAAVVGVAAVVAVVDLAVVAVLAGLVVGVDFVLELHAPSTLTPTISAALSRTRVDCLERMRWAMRCSPVRCGEPPSIRRHRVVK
jgi:hypothetical protein